MEIKASDRKKMRAALVAAVSAVGGYSELARRCKVGQPAVWRWLNLQGRVPAHRAIQVEEVTGIPRERLRPDLYPS